MISLGCPVKSCPPIDVVLRVYIHTPVETLVNGGTTLTNTYIQPLEHLLSAKFAGSIYIRGGLNHLNVEIKYVPLFIYDYRVIYKHFL